MDAADSIASISAVGYLGILVGPPLYGGLASLFNGLRWSFIVNSILLFLIVFVSFFIKDGDHLEEAQDQRGGGEEEEVVHSLNNSNALLIFNQQQK